MSNAGSAGSRPILQNVLETFQQQRFSGADYTGQYYAVIQGLPPRVKFGVRIRVRLTVQVYVEVYLHLFKVFARCCERRAYRRSRKYDFWPGVLMHQISIIGIFPQECIIIYFGEAFCCTRWPLL